MAETKLATRILNKYDSYTAWFNANPILKKGEISICEVPVETDKDNAVTQSSKPAILFKVGDGKTAWKSLPWATGLAGDVHGWAKAANKPSYNASEIVNLEEFIGQNDTNTTYKLVQDTDDGHKFSLQKHEKSEAADTWTTVTTITIPDNDHNQTVSAGSVTFGADDAVNFVAGTGITITGDASKKTITVEAKKPTEAGTADKVKHALTLQIEGSNEVTFDGSAAKTFNVTAAALGLSGAMHFRGTVTAIPPTGTYASGDVVLFGKKEYVYDNSNATKPEKDKWIELGDEGSYALKTITATATDDDVVVLTGTSGSNGVTYDAKHAKKGPAAGNTVKGPTEDVTVSGSGATGSIKVPKVTVDEYGHTTGLTEQTLSITMPTLPEKLPNPHALTFTGAVTGTYDGSADKTAHIPTIAEMTAGLSNDDAAVANQFVTVVKQTNGVVSVTRAQPTADDVSGLAAIAKTGNVKDLLQSEGDTLILDCGSATVNI